VGVAFIWRVYHHDATEVSALRRCTNKVGATGWLRGLRITLRTQSPRIAQIAEILATSL
jgi:hypothetical protein